MGWACAITRSQAAKAEESGDDDSMGLGDLFDQSSSRKIPESGKEPEMNPEADQQVTEEAEGSMPNADYAPDAGGGTVPGSRTNISFKQSSVRAGGRG